MIPHWTVFANIANGKYLGMAWFFFDEKADAKQKFDRLNGQGHIATMRPFHLESDLDRMAAVDYQSITTFLADTIKRT